MNIKKFGYKALDYFTRTWAAFWGTVVFCILYVLWNKYAPKALRFDEMPYLFLCMIITLLSYFQNIIIMTIQREDHEIQVLLEKKQEEMETKQFDMIEDIYEEVVPDAERQNVVRTDETPETGGQAGIHVE